MLAILFAAIWFGYRASRAGRNATGWAFIGVLVFIVLKILLTVAAMSTSIHSEEEAITLSVILTIFMFGGIFIFGLLIQPKQGATENVPRANIPQEPEINNSQSQFQSEGGQGSDLLKSAPDN
ncbi:MAG: hypothetical protein U0Z53_20185 [Blastocatellia bacterium]